MVRLQTLQAAGRISQVEGEVPAVWRGSGARENQGAAVEAIQQAQDVEGSDTLLLRRTYPELESSLLAQFRRDVPPTLFPQLQRGKTSCDLDNGSTTRFGYCRNENDVYQYQGAEFLFIGIDELTHFTLKQWQFLTSRNRCPIPGAVFRAWRGRLTLGIWDMRG